VLDGKTAETILEYAELWKADLIVMGAQSHNSFEKVLMGDVAVNVLKHSPMAVLIVPTDKQEQDMVSEKEEIHLYI
jgi:nucleotide-binding universal stress UspA family protein